MKQLVTYFLSFAVIIIFNACTKNESNHSQQNVKLDQVLNKKSTYVCPMHPQISSDKPGSCSICGMDLVQVDDLDDHEDHDHIDSSENSDSDASDKQKESKSLNEEGVDSQKVINLEPRAHAKTKLSLNKQQMIGVKLDKVLKRKLFKTIRVPGRIAFDPELYTAQSEYLEALRQWGQVKNSPIGDVKRSTKEMIRSAKIRLKVLGLSEGQIALLGKKGSQSEGLLLTGKNQENWVYADVFEVDLPNIKKGLSAEISANFLQGKKLFGTVISVDEVINPATRTAKVRIQLKKNTQQIRPESYVNVSIYAPLGTHLTVPIDALMDTGREILVFIKKSKSTFEPRLVKVILETDSYAAILAGVAENEDVVVGGNFMLDSESRLKSVIKGALSGDAEHKH